jgi:hypothetical protein
LCKKRILVLLNRPLKTDIIKMLKFFIDDIFDMFGGRVVQSTVGIPVDTNCTSDLFLCLYQTYFNFTFCYIDDVLSLPEFVVPMMISLIEDCCLQGFY